MNLSAGLPPICQRSTYSWASAAVPFLLVFSMWGSFGKIKIDEAISATGYGLHVIPGSVAFTDEFGSIDPRGIVEGLRKKYDIILVDSAPGFGLEVFAGMKACDELLICCQPRVPAIAGTLQTFRAADRLKILVFGVVLNRVTKKRFEIPIADIKRTLGWPILAVIPDDDMVEEGVTRGVPVVLHAPNSPAAIEFRKLAQAVLTHLRARKRIASHKRKAGKTPRLARLKSPFK